MAWWRKSCEAGIISAQNSQGNSTSGELGAAAWKKSSSSDGTLLLGLYLAKSGLHPLSCWIRSSWGIGTLQNSQGIVNSVGGLGLRLGGWGAGPKKSIWQSA